MHNLPTSASQFLLGRPFHLYHSSYCLLVLLVAYQSLHQYPTRFITDFGLDTSMSGNLS